MFPWFLKPEAEVEARWEELEKLRYKKESNKKKRSAWQREWVELGHILSAHQGRNSSKEDWGCASGKCDGGVCSNEEENFAFRKFRDPGPAAYVPPEQRSSVSTSFTPCLLTIMLAGLLLWNLT
jgi:hypothetical protein